MSTMTADVRYSVRSLLKNPGLTLAAVPGALRIAAMENREGQSRSWSYPNFVDFRDRVTMIVALRYQ